MGHKVKQSLMSSRIDFFYYAFRNVLLVSVPLLVVSALILGFSASHSSATNSGSDSVTLTLSTSCTLSSSIITPHHASLNGGQYEESIGNTRINTYCNDNNGYSIYAIGTSNNIDGNTDLVSDLDEHYNIHTGAYANGNNIGTSTPSFWGMKLTPGIGTGSSSELTPPTIMNSYNSYNVVPSSYTLVASRTSGTNMTIDTDITGSYFNTTYNIYASSVQPAGSYEGKVKYVMIHPHSDNSNITIENAFALNDKERHGLYYAMQDMTTEICNAVNIYDETSQTQLIDTRDNKLYWVAKLQDGHCWMTQNLDTDINPSISFNSNNTDLNVAYNSSTKQYIEYNDGYTENNGVIYWTPASSAVSSGSWSNQNNYPYSKDIGIDYPDNIVTKTIAGSHALAGNYYNWTAAIASNNSSSLTQNTLSDISKNPKNSICPKGWRLPTISNESETLPGSTNEFARLSNLYGKTPAQLMAKPLWFIRSGGIWSSSVSDSGITGRYWSNTMSGSSRSYYIFFNESQILPNGTNNRSEGYSIRCIAR